MAAKKSNAPSEVQNWRAAFQSSAMRTSFCLALSQPMLEFLCAVAEGVRWDRALYYQQYGIAKPDNWLAASHALQKRGLIGPHAPVQLAGTNEEWCGRSNWVLTPAGEALVQLLKVAGIFVSADAALMKRTV
jgi:hypothetical protein